MESYNFKNTELQVRTGLHGANAISKDPAPGDKMVPGTPHEPCIYRYRFSKTLLTEVCNIPRDDHEPCSYAMEVKFLPVPNFLSTESI